MSALGPELERHDFALDDGDVHVRKNGDPYTFGDDKREWLAVLGDRVCGMGDTPAEARNTLAMNLRAAADDIESAAEGSEELLVPGTGPGAAGGPE